MLADSTEIKQRVMNKTLKQESPGPSIAYPGSFRKLSPYLILEGAGNYNLPLNYTMLLSHFTPSDF